MRDRIRFLRRASLRGTLTLAALGLFAAPAAASREGFYGVNVQQVFGGTSASWQPQLAAMSAGGLQLARIDAFWPEIEPSAPVAGRHSYNWAFYDSIVTAMAQHGIRWNPILAYSTSWSGLTPGDTWSAVAPAHVGDFAAYAAALARRYGRGGSFWGARPSLQRLPVVDYEIWNEENSASFLHPQDAAPERYADLYLAARGAIKSVDPAAKAVVGGLALGKAGVIDEEQFLKRMYAHDPGLAGNVDGVALHPYQSTVADTYMRLARFRQALDRVAGPSVPIEVTEAGWATTSVSEAERAADLAQLAVDLPRSDCNVDRFLPYTWITREQNPADPEDWFGIWNRSGSAKPSGQAYLDAVRLMRGMSSQAAPTGIVPICHPASSGSASSSARSPRLGLSLQILRVRRRRSVTVAVRCRPSCVLRVELLAHKARPLRRTRVAVRGAALSDGRKVLTLRIRHARRLDRRGSVRATAVGPAGGVTVRQRIVRIR